MAGRVAIDKSILSAIGNTPLVDITGILGLPSGVKLLAKLEYLNPGGSIKDRPALFIVRKAIEEGRVQGKKLLDASSGNMGISLSLVGAALGIPVRIVVPAKTSEEKQRIMRLLGAEVVHSDPLEEIDGAIMLARQIAEENPTEYYYADQYSNPANVESHYETTGREILEQTGGELTHFIAGVGTSGTLMGVARRLREYDGSVRIVEVQPDAPLHGIEGLKHMKTALVPRIYDPSLVDEHLTVNTEEAYHYARLLASRGGILCGASAGANVAAAVRVARRLSRGLLVTVLPDGASRYLDFLSEK